MSNQIELSGIFSEGYGFVPKKLMKAKDLKASTKLLLCYLLSYTGAGIECFPPLTQITDDTGISKRTIISCIKEAIDHGYLAKKQKQRGRGIGKKNIYTLLFMQDFASAKIASAKIASAKIASANACVASAKSDTLQVQNSTSNNNMNNNTNNNNNNEQDKNREEKRREEKNNAEFKIPPSLSAHKDFLPTWETWIKYRKEMRKRITPTTAAGQLVKMEKMGPDRAIAMIRYSIENGWQGLFEEKSSFFGGKTKQQLIMEKLHGH